MIMKKISQHVVIFCLLILCWSEDSLSIDFGNATVSHLTNEYSSIGYGTTGSLYDPDGMFDLTNKRYSHSAIAIVKGAIYGQHAVLVEDRISIPFTVTTAGLYNIELPVWVSGIAYSTGATEDFAGNSWGDCLVFLDSGIYKPDGSCVTGSIGSRQELCRYEEALEGLLGDYSFDIIKKAVFPKGALVKITKEVAEAVIKAYEIAEDLSEPLGYWDNDSFLFYSDAYLVPGQYVFQASIVSEVQANIATLGIGGHVTRTHIDVRLGDIKSNLPPTGSPPADISGFGMVHASCTKIDLAWTDNSNNEQGFHIYAVETASNGWDTEYLIGTVGANITTFADTNPYQHSENYTPGKRLKKYCVYAFNAAGESRTPNYSWWTPVIFPTVGEPLNLRLICGINNIGLAWDNNLNNEAIRFDVSYSTSPDYDPWHSAGKFSASALTGSVSGLMDATRYFIKIVPVSIVVLDGKSYNCSWPNLSCIVHAQTLKGNKLTSFDGDLNFGRIIPGNKATKEIAIYNQGNADLFVFGLECPQGYSADWTNGSISPGQKKKIKISFNPTEEKIYDGEIRFICNSTGGMTAISCFGRGIDAENRYSGGQGTYEKPYVIAYPCDLINLGYMTNDYNKYFILAKNIDFKDYFFSTSIIALDSSSDYDFQGTKFGGKFYGNGHLIKNLTINTSYSNAYVGLFGTLGQGAEIKNLGIQDVNITAGSNSYCVGALCGFNDNGDITQCYSTGIVKAGSGSDSIGGLCGWNSSILNNCYSNCSVKGGIGGVGGFCGVSYVTVENCYSTGKVEASNPKGFCGASNIQYIINCFWDTNTSQNPTSSGGTPKTTSQMKTVNTFTAAGWNISQTIDSPSIWFMQDGIYPMLFWEIISNNPADFNFDGKVDFIDYTFFASKWMSVSGDSKWDSSYDLSFPKNNKIDISDLKVFASVWLDGISTSEPDINSDNSVDFKDYAILASQWQNIECGEPYWCDGGDINHSGSVTFADILILAENWLEITISEGPVVIYKQKLDTNPDWITQGQWQFGQPLGQGGTYGNTDPTSGYTGNNVYGVNLAGNYSIASSDIGPYYLAAGPFNCSQYHNIKLEFARWLNMDEPLLTTASVEVSNDGQNWFPVWEYDAALPIGTITDYSWIPVEYDISQYADEQSTVYIRWMYTVYGWAGASSESGWNIDDIVLTGEK